MIVVGLKIYGLTNFVEKGKNEVEQILIKKIFFQFFLVWKFKNPISRLDTHLLHGFRPTTFNLTYAEVILF